MSVPATSSVSVFMGTIRLTDGYDAVLTIDRTPDGRLSLVIDERGDRESVSEGDDYAGDEDEEYACVCGGDYEDEESAYAEITFNPMLPAGFNALMTLKEFFGGLEIPDLS